MPERSWPTGFSRVHQKTGRLVNHQKIFRFIQDLELNLILRLHATSFPIYHDSAKRGHANLFKRGGRIRALDNVSWKSLLATSPWLLVPAAVARARCSTSWGDWTPLTLGKSGSAIFPLHDARDADLTSTAGTISVSSFNSSICCQMTVAENVELPLLLRGERKATPRVVEAFELVDLAKRRNHYPHQLSGGEMQRAAIARAVAGQPKILLADEPTGNLDSGSAAQVADTLLKIASKNLQHLLLLLIAKSWPGWPRATFQCSMEKLPRKLPNNDKLLAKFTVFADLDDDELIPCSSRAPSKLIRRVTASSMPATSDFACMSS